MKDSTLSLIALCLCCSMTWHLAHGHGRFINPPSRASMWRYGFNNPQDYNDNEGFCGGLQKMIELGGCGICGDAFNLQKPRPHETGGRYGNGIIVRRYIEGQVINVTTQITANHEGYFTFRICPSDSSSQDPKQLCFDSNVLKVYPTMTDTYVLPDNKQRNYDVQLQLPPGMTCSRCVIQWSYTSGNNWGVCPDGSQGLGCGAQEMFRACSDVSIAPGYGTVITPTTTLPTTKTTEKSTEQPPVITTEESTEEPSVTTTEKTTEKPQITTTQSETTTNDGRTKSCVAVGAWASINGMEAWCNVVCNTPQPFCSASYCLCE